MFDYHMHSIVSYDGHDTPQALVDAALKAGLKEICFTDHVDDGPPCNERFNRFTIEEYSEAYDTLKAEGILIRRGFEFGILQDNQPLLKEYISKYPFDFIIGSMHYYDDQDMYFSAYWDGKTQEEAERLYFERMLECVRVHDDFDVLGHLTYISKTAANPTKRLIPYKMFAEITDEVMKILVAKGKGMEVNTSGVDRCGDFLPSREYLLRFKELGGEIVTVGSDAHTADRVGQYTHRACELVKDVFGYVCTFENRKPIFHKL